MKYSELISFNPIESTIQLVESNKTKEAAANLVDTYVVSDTMAENLNVNIVNQLQMNEVIDNKGVLIVGNYGTGKSHLMSVIAAVATDADNVQYIHNPKLAEGVKPIAGEFEALRIEIGGVTMSLREIIMEYIQEDFEARGLTLNLPDFDTVKDNKKLIKDTMELFATKYPDKGYLIVVDEFLSYLSSRTAHQITLDLEFLRALGEMCSKSKIRVVFGVQEKIFDNPRFSFVSDTLKKVSDRFSQCIITKEATSYVVSERILKKTPEQKAMIRAHLEKFSSLYTGMSVKMEQFVDLFPIHPSYIDVFNQLYLIETRHILKNISVTIRNIFDQEVPENEPGVISFDNYWPAIKANATLKTDPTVSKVINASSQLEDIINVSFPKAHYKPLALQIIRALSVYKLGTGIDSQAGLTAASLKDDLCIFIQMPEFEADFLLGMVNQTLKDIMSTVSGQFITYNEDNNQYYIDVDKTVDYDEKVKQKAESMSNDEFNRYFYKAVYSCLEWDAGQYVTNFEIYEYDINWDSHNIFREGYLFMGIPGERSTAQPERDFYIHIMPPYGVSMESSRDVADEVYFYFKSTDEFKQTLSYYAAASSLAQISDGKDKDTYNQKANQHRKKLLRYLNENKNTCFDVEYKKDKKQLIEVLKGRYNPDDTFKDAIDLAASICFDKYFDGKYPKFPVMGTKITKNNFIDVVSAAYDHFGGRTSKLSKDILSGFNLLDAEGNIKPENSDYASYYINLIKGLSPQGVINFSDIYEIQFMDEKYDKQFGIDYRLCAIIFLALVYAGHAMITLTGDKKLTAGTLDSVTTTNHAVIAGFKHISKPADLPMAELKKLYEVIGLKPAELMNSDDRDKSIDKLLAKAQELSNSSVIAERILDGDFTLWGEPLVNAHHMTMIKSACVTIKNEFSNYSSKYTTAAKLNNFNHSIDEIEDFETYIKCLKAVNEYKEFKGECGDIVNYISNVEVSATNSNLLKDIEAARNDFRTARDSIFDGTAGVKAAQTVKATLSPIKDTYIDEYLAEHKKRRLDINEAKRKGSLIDSAEFKKLKKLKGIETIPGAKLTDIENSLSGLHTCYELTKEELKKSHICPHCKLDLAMKEAPVHGQLDYLEQRIDKLMDEWTDTLVETVSDPLVANQKEFLSDAQKAVIDDFVNTEKLPDKVDDFFVDAVNSLLKGFEPVVINPDDLIQALEKLPPLDEVSFKARFNEIIKSYIEGKDANKLRIAVQRNNSEE